MTTDDTTPGTLQAQWTARLDDIERRFSNVARVQADGLERALVLLGDKSRECEQLKERVRMAEERASTAESKCDAQLQVSAEFDRDNNRLIARVDTLISTMRKQLMEPTRWQDEDIDGHAFGPVMMICQHCGSGDENADALEHAEDCAYVAIRAALGDAAPATPDKPAANAGVSCDVKHGPCACGAWHITNDGNPNDIYKPAACDHSGIGLPGCEVCDPRVRKPAYPCHEDECKWCSNPSVAGDNVCEAHRKLNASMSSKPAETQAATCGATIDKSACIHGTGDGDPCDKCAEYDLARLGTNTARYVREKFDQLRAQLAAERIDSARLRQRVSDDDVTWKEQAEDYKYALARAEEENARLRRKYEHGGCAHGSHCKECFFGDDEDAIGHLFRGEWATNEERDQLISGAFARDQQLQAALGRAVATLRELRSWWTNDGSKELPWIKQADATLADPTSAAAGEAYAEEQAVIDVARALVEHDNRARSGGFLKPYEGQQLRDRLRDAVAKVDARRGA